MISRNTAITRSFGRTLEEIRRRISASRSGRYAGPPFFSLPISAARPARRSRSFANSSSSASISRRSFSRSAISRQIAHAEDPLHALQLGDHLARNGPIGADKRVSRLSLGLVQQVVEPTFALSQRTR